MSVDSTMYVCICRQITDSQIRDVCQGGASTLPDVCRKLGVASECGKCGKLAQAIVSEYNQTVTLISVAS
jgi:bacterioferritin-associated ferredoxin